jgi:CPA1 family monovalent cation:H+ antiporter
VNPFDFWTAGILLLAAAVVAMVSARLRLPYAAGLVVAGIVLALIPGTISWRLTPELIFFVFLPPLVFEAAIQIHWQPFRRELPLLFALVTIGVAIGAAVVAAGMHWIAGWSWLGAAFFGVLIAATDPVSVIAAFKATRVQERLHLLVEAESLLNDGVAAVGFAVLVALAAGGAADAPHIALDFAVTAAGGVAVGALVALPLILTAGGTGDRLVELTLTMLIAYGSFLIAEHFHMSGVLATLTAGMIVGNYALPRWFTGEGRASTITHWEFIAFIANSIIFLLIGTHEVDLPWLRLVEAVGLAIVLALAGRAATVYPIALAFARTRLALSWGYKHVLFWGGLRGALALALALALPVRVAERGAIVTVTFGVVAFSIFVQGLTMPWLVKKLGLLLGQSAGSAVADVVSEQADG